MDQGDRMQQLLTLVEKLAEGDSKEGVWLLLSTAALFLPNDRALLHEIADDAFDMVRHSLDVRAAANAKAKRNPNENNQ